MRQHIAFPVYDYGHEIELVPVATQDVGIAVQIAQGVEIGIVGIVIEASGPLVQVVMVENPFADRYYDDFHDITLCDRE